MPIDQQLIEQVNSWLEQDPDPITKKQLTDLFAAAKENEPGAVLELTDAFRAPLEFGTAGLRGALGAGPNRMNRVTVLQAVGGLAQYLIKNKFHKNN